MWQASFPSRWFEPIPSNIFWSICREIIADGIFPAICVLPYVGSKATQVVSGLHPFSTKIMRTHSSILVAGLERFDYFALHFPSSLSAAAARARKLRKRWSSASSVVAMTWPSLQQNKHDYLVFWDYFAIYVQTLLTKPWCCPDVRLRCCRGGFFRTARCRGGLGEGDMSDSPTTVMPQATASPFFIGQQVAVHPLVKPNETRYSWDTTSQNPWRPNNSKQLIGSNRI